MEKGSSSGVLGFAFTWAKADNEADTMNKTEKMTFFMSNYIKKQFAGDYLISLNQKQDKVFKTNALSYGLTNREKEITMYIKEGLDYEKIAEKLHISRHTVNRHVQNIYEKTGSNSKISLIDKLF